MYTDCTCLKFHISLPLAGTNMLPSCPRSKLVWKKRPCAPPGPQPPLSAAEVTQRTLQSQVIISPDLWTLQFKQSHKGFPGGSDGKVSVCNAGDLGWIPGLGRSPGEQNGNPLQYSCLENPMDSGAWQATSHGVTKSRTQLSN